MDTAGVMFTGLTLASVIATAGLTINLTENFGTLSTDSQVQTEVGGDRLVGTYANAVTGMSAVVVGLTGLYLIFYIYGWCVVAFCGAQCLCFAQLCCVSGTACAATAMRTSSACTGS